MPSIRLNHRADNNWNLYCPSSVGSQLTPDAQSNIDPDLKADGRTGWQNLSLPSIRVVREQLEICALLLFCLARMYGLILLMCCTSPTALAFF